MNGTGRLELAGRDALDFLPIIRSFLQYCESGSGTFPVNGKLKLVKLIFFLSLMPVMSLTAKQKSILKASFYHAVFQKSLDPLLDWLF